MKSPAAQAKSHRYRVKTAATMTPTKTDTASAPDAKVTARAPAARGLRHLRYEGAGRNADERPHIDQGKTADQHHERELAVAFRWKRARQSHVQAEAERALEALAPENYGETPPDLMQARDHDAPSPADRLGSRPNVAETRRSSTATSAVLMAAAAGALREQGLVTMPRGLGEVPPCVGGLRDPCERGGEVGRRVGPNQPAGATVLHHLLQAADGGDHGRATVSHGLDRDTSEGLGQTRGNRDDVGPHVVRARIGHERHHGDDVAEPERFDGLCELTLASGVLEGVPNDADLGPDRVRQVDNSLDQDVLPLDAADPVPASTGAIGDHHGRCRAEVGAGLRLRCRSPESESGPEERRRSPSRGN